MATRLTREIVFLLLQLLDEENCKNTVHALEKESGFFFNMKYFEIEIRDGSLDVAENYLSGFTKINDNRYSLKIYFEIRKQKYLEALDKNDYDLAVEILIKDLKYFASVDESLYEECILLITLKDYRENKQLSKHGDKKLARTNLFTLLKTLIIANPMLKEKLQFPNMQKSRLRHLVNQSLNWQHMQCEVPKPNPDIKTIFVDHSCGEPNVD